MIFYPDQWNIGDGLDLLQQERDASSPLVIFDPQYRQGLDKLAYGNEGEGRGAARAALPQMTNLQISTWLIEIERVLSPQGHCMLWVDKFLLVEGVRDLLNGSSLEPVDMLTWDKGKMGMGYRFRRQTEHMVVLQKPPKRAKGVWRNHSIPDVMCEKVVKNHPHTKPLEITKLLIEATTRGGDVVIDPCAGGYTTLTACEQTGRTFLGCDLL